MQESRRCARFEPTTSAAVAAVRQVYKVGLMANMNLDRFNLNLFVAFEALSKADTLTQAADALYVTQSTLSVALRQMREYFDDELFVYKPKQKQLTPLAQSLRPRVLEILKTAKATLMLKEDTASFGRTRCLADRHSNTSPARCGCLSPGSQQKLN
jgi:hypothetical protein